MNGKEKEIVKAEICHKCQSKNFLVNHYLKERHHGRIYLECANCGHFSARIIVHAYTDPDQFKSFLHFIKNSLDDTTKNIMQSYKTHTQRAISQASAVKKMLMQQNQAQENKDAEKTLYQLYEEYQIIQDG